MSVTNCLHKDHLSLVSFEKPSDLGPQTRQLVCTQNLTSKLIYYIRHYSKQLGRGTQNNWNNFSHVTCSFP